MKVWKISAITFALAGNEMDKPSSASDKLASATAPTVVQFTSDGSGTNNAGYLIAVNSGFNPKTLIELKRPPTAENSQWEVQYLNDDGSVGIHKLILKEDVEAKESGPIGDLEIVLLDTLIKDYKPTRVRSELFRDVQKQHVRDSDAARETFSKSVISIALANMEYANCFTEFSA